MLVKCLQVSQGARLFAAGQVRRFDIIAATTYTFYISSPMKNIQYF